MFDQRGIKTNEGSKPYKGVVSLETDYLRTVKDDVKWLWGSGEEPGVPGRTIGGLGPGDEGRE